MRPGSPQAHSAGAYYLWQKRKKAERWRKERERCQAEETQQREAQLRQQMAATKRREEEAQRQNMHIMHAPRVEPKITPVPARYEETSVPSTGMLGGEAFRKVLYVSAFLGAAIGFFLGQGHFLSLFLQTQMSNPLTAGAIGAAVGFFALPLIISALVIVAYITAVLLGFAIFLALVAGILLGIGYLVSNYF